jgi:hypothetical protein
VIVIPIPVPLGIDGGAGGAVFPEDPDEPTGSGVVSGLDPDTIDTGFPDNDDEEPPPPPEDDDGYGYGEVEPPVTAQWQTTRYVTLANTLRQKCKVVLTYETLDEDDEPVEDTCEVELDPGEICDIEQEGWLVNARRIKFVVTTADGMELKRFKDEWLNLVPETDDDDVPGYASPEKQRCTISVR